VDNITDMESLNANRESNSWMIYWADSSMKNLRKQKTGKRSWFTSKKRQSNLFEDYGERSENWGMCQAVGRGIGGGGGGGGA